jgi:periplasmic protein TonB
MEARLTVGATFLSLVLHAGLGLVLVSVPMTASRSSLVPMELDVRRVPEAPPPPPPTPRLEEPPAAPSAAPVEAAAPKLRKPARAAGPRADPDVPPDVTAAPLRDSDPADPAEVQLPSGDGEGAGGDAAAGDGEVGGGSGDGVGDGDGGRPPLPLGDARRLRLPYTRAAIEARVGGVVLVSLRVNEKGIVDDAKLLAGLGHGLDPIALAKARQLRFQPALDRHGRPIAARIVWHFRFERP